MLTLRKAQAADFETVAAIFRRAVADMGERGIFQWDEVYPSEATLQEDIDGGDMHIVCSDECIIGAIVLNDRQDEQYLRGDWRHNEPAAVVHRLCIDPACQQKGYGMQAMQLAEAALKEQGYRSVRLDAFSQNPYALRLYERLGYRRAGEALYRKGLFYLLEKCL